MVPTSLGNDSAGDNDNNWPVELSFEVLDNLLADLAESSEGTVGNAQK